jgi:hypothetical protein
MPRKTKHQKRRVSRKQNLPKKRRQTAHKKKGSQNRTKRGGKQYGKGAKGTLFDIYLADKPKDKETLIEKIGDIQNVTIILYKSKDNIPTINAEKPEEVSTTETESTEVNSSENNEIPTDVIDTPQKKAKEDNYTFADLTDNNQIINWLKDTPSPTNIHNTQRLAKIFTDKNAFLLELIENRNVYNILKGINPSLVNDISTLEDDFKIGENSFSGIEIKKQKKIINYLNPFDNNIFYVLFTKKCKPYPNYILVDTDENIEIPDQNPKILMKTFFNNILNAILIINKANYYHNDIKLSNIVYDNNNKSFKLIDWGASKTIDKDYDNGGLAQCVHRGDPIFSSLYKMYIRYTTVDNTKNKTIPEHLRMDTQVGLRMAHINKSTPSLVSIIPFKILQYDTTNLRGKAKPDLSYYYAPDSKSSSQKLAKQSIKNFYDYQSKTFRKNIALLETSKNKNYDDIKKELFNNYHKSFDLHMFGMTIFHAVYIFDLDYHWIDDYAIPFTNLDPKSEHAEFLTNPFEKMEDLISKINSFSITEKVSTKGVWVSPKVYELPKQ